MFKTFYDSALSHPGIAFIATALFLIVFALRQRFLIGFVTLFGLEIVADAFFTGAYTPAANTAWMQPVAITFVILGDYRYFVAIEKVLATKKNTPVGGMGPVRPWLAAAALAFIVPVASVIPQKTMPQYFTQLNAIFLVYEAMFFMLALVLYVGVLPKRLKGVDSDLAQWVKRLTIFELVQYGLWATADVLILSGITEPGYLLRLVPNFLYYGAFLPFLYFSAPARLRVGEATS